MSYPDGVDAGLRLAAERVRIVRDCLVDAERFGQELSTSSAIKLLTLIAKELPKRKFDVRLEKVRNEE